MSGTADCGAGKCVSGAAAATAGRVAGVSGGGIMGAGVSGGGCMGAGVSGGGCMGGMPGGLMAGGSG